MRAGEGRGKAPMRGWTVERHLRKGPLTAGQKQPVKLILSEKDRTVGVQGYAGVGKTRMLDRARALAEKKGWRMVGLAPSASAVRTLTAESGIESETLQRFLARNSGVAEGRLTRKGAKEMRAAFAKTALVVDEGFLASTVQARDLLRIARELRIPKLVLVGDSKQLDAVDAGKPVAQLQAAGMKTATMDEIMRQRDPDLKGSGRGEPRGRNRQGVRQAQLQCRRSEARQHRRRRRRALAEALSRGARAHRGDGAEPRVARTRTGEGRESGARQGTAGPGGFRATRAGAGNRAVTVPRQDAGHRTARQGQAHRDGYGFVT